MFIFTLLVSIYSQKQNNLIKIEDSYFPKKKLLFLYFKSNNRLKMDNAMCWLTEKKPYLCLSKTWILRVLSSTSRKKAQVTPAPPSHCTPVRSSRRDYMLHISSHRIKCAHTVRIFFDRRHSERERVAAKTLSSAATSTLETTCRSRLGVCEPKGRLSASVCRSLRDASFSWHFHAYLTCYLR